VSGYLLTFRKAIWLHLLNSSIVRNYKTSCPRATTLHSYISEYTEFEATEFVFLKEKRANKNTENRKPRGKRQKERQLKLSLFFAVHVLFRLSFPWFCVLFFACLTCLFIYILVSFVAFFFITASFLFFSLSVFTFYIFKYVLVRSSSFCTYFLL